MCSGSLYKVTGAGRWFPAEPTILRQKIEGYVGQASLANPSRPILGAIAPHAGLAYSGAVAGYTYAALRASARRFGKPDVVVVLGFCHQPAIPGFALLDARSILTPLGEIAVARDATEHFMGAVEDARLDSQAHAGEHSAENQLPFLQCALPDVPVALGLVCGHDANMMAEIGQALWALSQAGSVVCIASTDLLHDPSYEKVCASDAETLRLMEKLDSDGLNKAWSYTQQVCCGIGPVLALLHFIRAAGGQRGEILFYQNSGDVDPSGRGHWVVGYGSIVFSGS